PYANSWVLRTSTSEGSSDWCAMCSGSHIMAAWVSAGLGVARGGAITPRGGRAGDGGRPRESVSVPPRGGRGGAGAVVGGRGGGVPRPAAAARIRPGRGSPSGGRVRSPLPRNRLVRGAAG